MMRSAAAKEPKLLSKSVACGHGENGCGAKPAPSRLRSSATPGNDPGALNATAPPRVRVSSTCAAPPPEPELPGTATGSDHGAAAWAADGIASAPAARNAGGGSER